MKTIFITENIVEEVKKNGITYVASNHGWKRSSLSKALKRYRDHFDKTKCASVLPDKVEDHVNGRTLDLKTLEKDSVDKLKSHRVMIIGDTHIPFEHPRYFDFIRQTYDEFQCDTMVHIGDVVDNHAISYHEHNPDGMSPGDELKQAIKTLETKWYKHFPNVKVCMGNHDELIYRKAMTHGLPKAAFRSLNEILQAPAGWIWNFSHEIDHVLYQHGTGTSGKTAHATRSMNNRQSTVIGHIHSHGGVAYVASNKDLIFGLNVGCGIRPTAYAMTYGRDFVNRPTLGCGIVLDGKHAFFIPMDLGAKILYK